MKILYVTTTGSTMRFFISYIRALLDEGHTVEIATNELDSKVQSCYYEWGCEVYHIDTSRSPLDKNNFRAIKQIKKLVTGKKYDIVHCHTPVAALCARIACRKARRQGTRVIYTAHGFYFYKGAPMKNWLMYYPVEKFCAHFTDVLITINKEDYALARKKMKAKRVEYVPGVGIDLTKFGKAEAYTVEKRRELGVPDDAPLLLSVGELNENKNHETVIRAISDTADVYYVIVGIGSLRERLQEAIDEMGIGERVKLLGYRQDVGELCEAADIFIMPSFREGLPVSLMEAMASGLPCVVSNIRGNADLIDEEGGFLLKPDDADAFKEKIELLLGDSSLCQRMGEHNKLKVKSFECENVIKKMKEIYEAVL